jgi:hypothetical protein
MASGPTKFGTMDSGIVRAQNATGRYFRLIYSGTSFVMQPLEKGCDERTRRCKKSKKGGRFEAEWYIGEKDATLRMNRLGVGSTQG